MLSNILGINIQKIIIFSNVRVHAHPRLIKNYVIPNLSNFMPHHEDKLTTYPTKIAQIR